MEKNTSGMNLPASGVAAPPPASAPPPPSAPPSYEEAVGSMAMVGVQGTVIQYPPGNTGNPSAYGTPGMLSQSAPDVPPNANATSPQIRTEVRVVRQPVPYALGPNPVKMQCPSCMAHIKTSTGSQRQPSAHICCIILCVLGCCLCSCLPYCMSAFLTVHHYCPNCNIYIGTWKG